LPLNLPAPAKKRKENLENFPWIANLENPVFRAGLPGSGPIFFPFSGLANGI
jgi:hypothetical protein